MVYETDNTRYRIQQLEDENSRLTAALESAHQREEVKQAEMDVAFNLICLLIDNINGKFEVDMDKLYGDKLHYTLHRTDKPLEGAVLFEVTKGSTSR